MFKRWMQVMDKETGGEGSSGGGAAGALSNEPGGAGAAGALSNDGTGTPGQGGAPGAGGGTPGTSAWYDTFKDQGVKDWLKNYGNAYPDAEAVAVKALNLEKFIGAEKANRGVIVPKSDAKPEEWRAFWQKVGGVPEKPDGYAVPTEGLKPEQVEALNKDPMVVGFREHAHKIGMPPQFFGAMMQWYTGEVAKMEQTNTDQFLRKSEAEISQLKTEWPGLEYDKNIEMGRRAAKSFIPHTNPDELRDTITKIEGALGTAATLKLWANIGKSMGEHDYVQGQGTGGMGGMTVESAKLRIAELKQDKTWAAKFASGDSDARAEWDRLNKIVSAQK